MGLFDNLKSAAQSGAAKAAAAVEKTATMVKLQGQLDAKNRALNDAFREAGSEFYKLVAAGNGDFRPLAEALVRAVQPLEQEIAQLQAALEAAKRS